ncbi:MAG: aspartate-semialdehyde dehydrogenase [Clostridium sp.]|jgi:aspartate-semialdehyde dehydrogenase|nr:aspartate-semialdehyde dehydrogenase [Clostridium sp.]MEE0126862.1 aspartate-semialdehyde dehydrogenase [Clostridia bacterium]
MKHYKLAIVGATGVVGSTALKVLEEKKLPISEYVLFASCKSAGKKVNFMNKEYVIKELNENSFDEGFDFAIFSAGGETAKKYAPIAASKGCIVVDNSSAFRMDPNVPLVVPEVNKEEIANNKGIIANPNCSTIQAVLPLKALDDKYKIKRIVYSTYQAVSGAGQKGLSDLENGRKGINKLEKFPYPIYNNCLPQIDVFTENGYTKEELKMINETRKILNNPDLKITATTVRVPVENSHSESINVEFEKDFELSELIETLKNFEGIIVKDDINSEIYPLATTATGHDDVFVGRIRRDFSIESGVNLWVVADNIRKGAASNAIQIVEKLIEM